MYKASYTFAGYKTRSAPSRSRHGQNGPIWSFSVDGRKLQRAIKSGSDPAVTLQQIVRLSLWRPKYASFNKKKNWAKKFGTFFVDALNGATSKRIFLINFGTKI